LNGVQESMFTQETIVVCVLTTDALGEVQSEVRTFGTLTKN